MCFTASPEERTEGVPIRLSFSIQTAMLTVWPATAERIKLASSSSYRSLAPGSGLKPCSTPSLAEPMEPIPTVTWCLTVPAIFTELRHMGETATVSLAVA